MLTLATDVQKIIMEFLKPKEIKKLYETCKVSKIMFEELTKHTNFILDCKEFISKKELKWFELKNIKLKLLETYIISKDGDQYWYKNEKKHRDNDLPAVITSDGDQFWMKNGLCHRDNDLPAIIFTDGEQYWYQNGERHRDNDLPAIIYPNGYQEWYKNDIKYYPKIIF